MSYEIKAAENVGLAEIGSGRQGGFLLNAAGKSQDVRIVAIADVNLKRARAAAGDFDYYPFLKALFQSGYKGPIGIQCINRPGDMQENLISDMKKWKELNSRLVKE